MVDISMCKNHNCEKKHLCYRYTATPGKWQSYAEFTNSKDLQCFWPIYLVDKELLDETEI